MQQARCLSRGPVVLATLLAAVLAHGAATPAAGAEGVLELRRGDRVCMIGNTLAERMRHFGYFETLLHQRLAERELRVRNLAYPADEVALRTRSRGFGSTDEYLTRQKADVVLAFFGFNESFAGEAGLDGFRRDVARLIEHTREQRYNRESPPRLVLISPIAAEDAEDPQPASAAELNARIKLYTEAMRDVAAAHDIPFVDLFTPTRKMLEQAERPLTLNGVHLTGAGYRELAPILVNRLIGKTDGGSGSGSPAINERLRQEVQKKSDRFFYAYRPINGYYIHGGRSQLRHEPDKSWTNADELEREREILRGMTENHDRRIWKLARGRSVPDEVDHSNVPSRFDIETNFTEDFEYLYGEDALESFTLPEGYRINLFASEQEFPELANPVALRFDGRGRLWVLTMPLFPMRRPDQELRGRLLIFEDTNGDGSADGMTVFADRLHVPTGFELGDGGAYVANQHNLLFLKDTTGDGSADVRRRVLQGFGTADAHHANSAFVWGPEGSLYFQEGVFLRAQVETPHGPVRLRDGGVFRYTPQRHELEVFLAYVFPNPWGHVFDRWGMNIITDGTGPDNYYGGMLATRHTDPRIDGDEAPDIGDVMGERAPNFSAGVRPNGGSELVSSRHLPDDVQGHFLVSNVLGFHGIRQFRLTDDGAGLEAEHVQNLLFSSDRSFRPIDMEFGPDGALYLCDFYSRLIGHMTHSLRDPNRDQSHGRIYRITHEDRPLLEPVHVAGLGVEQLLGLLKSPEDRTLYRARIELRKHDDEAVFPALREWRKQLDPDHPEHERHLLEVLWLHQARGVVEQDLLERLLQAEDFRARAAATRALRHWLNEVDDPYSLLEQQIHDPHPRVRLEAIVAVSFLSGEKAVELARAVENHEMDRHLEYALERTLEALEGKAAETP